MVWCGVGWGGVVWFAELLRGAVLCGAVRCEMEAEVGVGPSLSSCKSTSFRESQGFRHSRLPGTYCAASATHLGPAEEVGRRQAGQHGGR